MLKGTVDKAEIPKDWAEKDKNARIFTNPFVRSILALFCCLLWGSAFPCVKVGYEWLAIHDAGSQILFAGYRFFLAGIFTFLLGCAAEKRGMVPKRACRLSSVRRYFRRRFSTFSFISAWRILRESRAL